MYRILSRKLRQLGDFTYSFYCPACGYGHVFHVDHPENHGETWFFDGDVERPSISPGVLSNPPDNRNYHVGGIPSCHLLLKSGQLVYLNGCSHSLAGKVIELPDFPTGDEDE